MKKKIDISVTDIINRGTIQKNVPIPVHRRPIDCPIVLDKPMRFQDLYQKIVTTQARLGEASILKVLYESKKGTPAQTNRMKKKSINSVSHNGVKSGVNSAVSSGKKSVKSIHNVKVESRSEKENVGYRSNKKEGRKCGLSGSDIVPDSIEQCFEHLNHEEHCHIRERNQCFLSQRQIQIVLKQLGFDVNCSKYADFLMLLEVDIYGGAPCENLKQVLNIIQDSKVQNFSNPVKEPLPKIVDNNLQLILTQQKKSTIKQYFQGFKLPFVQNQKENSAAFANQDERIHGKLTSFGDFWKEPGNLLAYKDETQCHSREQKDIRTINQLIEALAHSEEDKCSLNVSGKLFSPNGKSDEKTEEEMSTFRRIQASGFDVAGNQSSFSRSLSGDKMVENREDESITELKSRLNQALKKSDSEATHLSDEGRLMITAVKLNQKPILSVDVNLGEGLAQKIIVYEGESAREVSDRLASKFTISAETKNKFQKMLESHLSTLLWKIDELSEEMLTDRDRDPE